MAGKIDIKAIKTRLRECVGDHVPCNLCGLCGSDNTVLAACVAWIEDAAIVMRFFDDDSPKPIGQVADEYTDCETAAHALIDQLKGDNYG